LKGVLLITNNNGVTGIVPALVASNDLMRSGEEVNNFGFALVTPLGTYNNGDAHTRSSFGT
jgi:hypothetical protein